MKSRTLLALAVAGTCAWSASAFAGGTQGARMNAGTSVEVQTPSSVNESAPWRTGQAHLGGWTPSSSMASSSSRAVYSGSDIGVGASSSVSGSGSVSSDPLATNEPTEYWLIGSESDESNVGSTASEGASGSVSFDSSMSGT